MNHCHCGLIHVCMEHRRNIRASSQSQEGRQGGAHLNTLPCSALLAVCRPSTHMGFKNNILWGRSMLQETFLWTHTIRGSSYHTIWIDIQRY